MFVFAFLTICKWRGHLEAHKDKFNPMLVGRWGRNPSIMSHFQTTACRENYNAELRQAKGEYNEASEAQN